jgi:hypothetical protein
MVGALSARLPQSKIGQGKALGKRGSYCYTKKFFLFFSFFFFFFFGMAISSQIFT